MAEQLHLHIRVRRTDETEGSKYVALANIDLLRKLEQMMIASPEIKEYWIYKRVSWTHKSFDKDFDVENMERIAAEIITALAETGKAGDL